MYILLTKTCEIVESSLDISNKIRSRFTVYDVDSRITTDIQDVQTADYLLSL